MNAGISVWGLGIINNTPTDVWLQDFIENQKSNYDSLSDFATILQNELRVHIPSINAQANPNGTIGFHLAGFVDYEGNLAPTFYHIHNGQSIALSYRGVIVDPAIINANHDLPPDLALKIIASGQVYITRNGDFTIYAALFEHLATFLQNLSQYRNLTIPHLRNLNEEAEWLRFQIRTMSELYRLSNLHLPTIGGKIDTLLITSNGVDKCGL